MDPLLSHSDLLNARRILFMTHLAIGDFVYHGPMLSALKQKYPDAELDIWIDDCRNRKKNWHSERNKALGQWIADTGMIDVLFPIASSEDERQKLIRRASRRRYDIIVYIATARTAKFASIARQISDKALVVGNEPNKIWPKLKQFRAFRGVNRKFVIGEAVNNKEHTEHIFERFKHRYEQCFGDLVISPENEFGLPIGVPQQSRQAIESWLDSQNTGADTSPYPIVLFNPFSTSSKRDLSSGTLIYTLEQIIEHFPKAHVIVNTSPSAEIGVKALLASHQFQAHSHISVFSATEDFFMLPALIMRADFVITVETSIMHFASTLNRPQLAIVRENTASWRPKRYVDLYWSAHHINEVEGRDLAPRVLGAMEKTLRP